MSGSPGQETHQPGFPRLPTPVRALAVAVLLALPLLGRFLDLSADPPLNVAFIHAFATDEGYYSFHARAAVLFGERPEPAFWDNERVSPLFDWLLRGSFSLLGVNLVALRLPQALLGCATVGLLYLLLRHAAGRRAAPWGALFLAWNHLFSVYNRVGMYQTLLTFLVTACALAWLLSWRRPAWALLAGAAAALALLTSLFSLLFLGGLAVATLLALLVRRPPAERGNRAGRGRWAALLSFLAGLALVLVPAVVLFVLPQAELVRRDLARSSALPFYTEALQSVANVFMALYHPFFLLNLLPLCGMLAYSGWTLARWRERRPEPLEALLLGWFWSGAAVLAVVNYRPTRYFLYLLVPLCAALALIVARWEEEVRRWPDLLRWLALPLLYVAGLVLWDHLGPRRFQGDALWWGGVAVAGAAVLAAVALSLGLRGRPALARWGSVLAVACLLGQAALGLSAWLGRGHSVEQVSRELGRLLPDNALLLRGCTLTLENRLHCLPMIEPEEVEPRALSGYRLFYLTEAPVEGLPGDRLWGTWPVLDRIARLYEVAPGRESLAGLEMGHY